MTTTTAPNLAEVMALGRTIPGFVGLTTALFGGASIRTNLLVRVNEWTVERYGNSDWYGFTPTGEGRSPAGNDIGSLLESAYAELLWSVRQYRSGQPPPSRWPLELPAPTKAGPERPALDDLARLFWRSTPNAMALVATTGPGRLDTRRGAHSRRRVPTAAEGWRRCRLRRPWRGT